MYLKLFALAALLLDVTASQAATPRRTLDAYGLVAQQSLTARALHVDAGDLGVVDGRLRAVRVVDAASSQLVAPSVRLIGQPTCAGVLSADVSGSSPGCPVTGVEGAALFDDLADACGMPSPFPPCDSAAAPIVVGAETRRLDPGTYGSLRVVDAAGILDLSGGSYTFCNLKVERGAKVRIHGPSAVHVAGDLVVGGSVAPAPGVAVSATDVRLFVAGRRVRVSRGAGVIGQICAPAARARLSRASLQGRLVANTISATNASLVAPYAETREPCAQRSRLRNVYFGDLHVHTTLSFDAYAYDVRTTPAQAYDFARGATVQLPPLDVDGIGTQTLQLDRPLDFAALTDHSEFLGEVRLCLTPGSPVYDSTTCQSYRLGGNSGTTTMALPSASANPVRHPAVCGADGQGCYPTAQLVWDEVQQAAEDAYDRTAACEFTSLVGYEYTASAGVSTLHRNVLFRNDRVPQPVTVFEAATREALWGTLDNDCRQAGTGCDVLVIPHNSNESNGKMFVPEAPSADVEGQRARAALRGSMEPIAEIYQHKGDSECSNGLSGILGAADEQCDFEKRRRTGTFTDCGDDTGIGGTITSGCVSRRDFLRGAWVAGLAEQERLGVDPFRLGVIASTDTHNGTPGAVGETAFIGHRGADDDTPAKQLGEGEFYPGGYRYSAGGLAAVWAEENSRPALFDALRRKETYGTSGPRMAVRFFGGFDLPADLCTDPQMVELAYASGIPMGGTLATLPAAAGAPSFLVSALKDPGTVARPGTPLQSVQIIKLWRDGGVAHQQVYDVAGDPDNGATVDDATCQQSGPGVDSLCAVWTDPDFDAGQHALYYVRVLENPSCRWSTYTCNALAPVDRPPSCSDPNVPRTVQERAWTSPIWFTPAS